MTDLTEEEVLLAARGYIDAAEEAGVATGRRLKVTRASEITMRGTRWLWEEPVGQDAVARFMSPLPPARWLPLGGLCLLGGREGIGKTTWAYRIAAQVTTGTLPGSFHGQPRSVVVAATEDDWARTIVPRLVAAGADLARVLRVDAIEDDHVSGLTLPADVGALQRLCAREGVVLILLDPLMGTISGALDTHKDAEVRQALEPLSRLAHDGQMTILGLIHVNKSQGSDLLTRLMASRAFSAVARAVLFASKEEPEPGADEKPHETFLLGQAKNNLAAKVPHSVRYHIEGVKVGHDDDLNEAIWSSHIVVDGRADGRIDDLMTAQESRSAQRDTPRDRACKWLRGYLTGKGAVESATVKAAGRAEGFSDPTIKRASTDLEIVVSYLPGANRTAWTLPTFVMAEPVEPVDLFEPVEPVVQSGTERPTGSTGSAAQSPREAEPVPDPVCCGDRGAGGPLATEGGPLQPRCQFCVNSPTYYKRGG
ncbi:AAA family ATPase [Asanoa iriomotensis]|uniref:AAA domain-containing protein n=1 Tax=Asanoa iriomotensis TaxID=234613 RepID=A0ABQ4C7Q2_9ACTN|nr:AAA family ATPase [Asanoa iriomotensis]GIF58764.1 hypothetical protein Air01nite_48590 [Asanoa iriomotensis]